MQPVEAYRRVARNLGPAEFRSQNPSPVLVARQIIGGRLSRAAERTSIGGKVHRLKPSTLVHVNPDEIDDPQADDVLITRTLGQEMCVQVLKTPRTPRDAPISIGRFDSSDVVIPDYTISKVHAWFAIDPLMGGYRLADAGSTNGTTVGEVRLNPGEYVAVKSGDRIAFGRLVLELYSAPDFHRYLTSPAAEPRVIDVSLVR